MMGGLVTYEAGPTVTLFEMLQVVYLPDHIKTKLYILPNLSHMGHQIQLFTDSFVVVLIETKSYIAQIDQG